MAELIDLDLRHSGIPGVIRAKHDVTHKTQHPVWHDRGGGQDNLQNKIIYK